MAAGGVMERQGRQGDVLLERVRKKHQGVRGLKPVAPDGGRVVLAYGEATGHAHALPADAARLYEHPATKERFLRVVRPTALGHEEHGHIPLARGLYRVIRQRFYTPEEIRTVAD